MFGKKNHQKPVIEIGSRHPRIFIIYFFERESKVRRELSADLARLRRNRDTHFSWNRFPWMTDALPDSGIQWLSSPPRTMDTGWSLFFNNIHNFWANWADSGIQWWTATAELSSTHWLWTPNEAFFNDILIFGANRTDQQSLGGLGCIFGQTISTNFDTLSPLSMISYILLFFC